MNVGADGCAFLRRGPVDEAFGKVESETQNGVCKSRLEAGTKHGPSRCYGAQKLAGWAVLLLV